MCYNALIINKRGVQLLLGVRTTAHIRYLAVLIVAAFIGGLVLSGHSESAVAQETICARSHTKVFSPRIGKVECVENSKSLQRDNQQLQKQRQRNLQQRLRQQQFSRQVRTRGTLQGSSARQRQATQRQKPIQRQRAVALRQKRLISEQRAILRDQQARQRRQAVPQK